MLDRCLSKLMPSSRSHHTSLYSFHMLCHHSRTTHIGAVQILVRYLFLLHIFRSWMRSLVPVARHFGSLKFLPATSDTLNVDEAEYGAHEDLSSQLKCQQLSFSMHAQIDIGEGPDTWLSLLLEGRKIGWKPSRKCLLEAIDVFLPSVINLWSSVIKSIIWRM